MITISYITKNWPWILLILTGLILSIIAYVQVKKRNVSDDGTFADIIKNNYGWTILTLIGILFIMFGFWKRRKIAGNAYLMAISMWPELCIGIGIMTLFTVLMRMILGAQNFEIYSDFIAGLGGH